MADAKIPNMMPRVTSAIVNTWDFATDSNHSQSV